MSKSLTAENRPNEPKANGGGAYRIQILERAFQVLGELENSGSGLSSVELSRRLKLHKSTAHRLVMVLQSERFVEKDEVSGKYRLGSRLMELGLSVLSQSSLEDAAKPHLLGLVRSTGETAHLGVLRDGFAVSILNCESSRTLRTPATVGARTPAHCASLGKALLAFGRAEALEAFLDGHLLQGFTARTITSPTKLREEMSVIRRLGYSVDDEEREEGLRCISAPIRDRSGEAVAAAGIAGPVFRITEARIPALSRSVLEATAKISKSLGHHLKHTPSAAEAALSEIEESGGYA